MKTFNANFSFHFLKNWIQTTVFIMQYGIKSSLPTFSHDYNELKQKTESIENKIWLLKITCPETC